MESIDHITRTIAAVRVDRTLGRAGTEETLAAGFMLTPRGARSFINRQVSAYTLLYLMEGCGRFVDWNGRAAGLRPGDLVQRMPGRTHTVRRDPDCRWLEFFLVLPASLFEALQRLGCIPVNRPLLHPGLTSLLVTNLQGVIRSLPHQAGLSAGQVVAESHALLARLFDADREHRRESVESQTVRRGREELSHDLHLRVAVREIAAEIGVGYETFRKLFRRYQGASPKEYRVRRRIDQARHLLSAEQLSVKEIAVRLGYPDVAAFVKQFRRVTGKTPSQFRESL